MKAPKSKPIPCLLCYSSTVPDERSIAGYPLFYCVMCEFRNVPLGAGERVDYDEVYRGEQYYKEQIFPQQAAHGKDEFLDHPTYRNFFQRLKPSPGDRLLDVGCGVGRFCRCAAGRGWSVEGIDLSSRAVEIATNCHEFPVRVATVEDLLLEPEKRFQVVTAFEVLEHLPDPKDFLEKVFALMPNGGQLFCTVPNWDCELVQNATRPDWLPPIHLNYFNLFSLKTLALVSGFRQVVCGINWTDPCPHGGLKKLKWLRRRLLKRENIPLGLWVHARKP